MIMVELANSYVIFMAVVTCIIATIDLIIGCKEVREGLPSLPWQSEEQKTQQQDVEATRAKTYVINDGYIVPNQESNFKNDINNNF